MPAYVVGTCLESRRLTKPLNLAKQDGKSFSLLLAIVVDAGKSSIIMISLEEKFLIIV